MDEIYFDVYNLLINIAPITNDYDFQPYMCFVCMLLEEWCKHNSQDILDVISKVQTAIIEVNKEEGQY